MLLFGVGRCLRLRDLLLGDVGNRLDIADNEERIESVRRRLNKSRNTDRRQDDAIAALQDENEQLELCLAALMTTLEKKGILASDEVRSLVEKLDPEPPAA